jgi:multiple sugar transport system permease protein
MPSKKVSLTGMRKREELTAWLFIAPVVLGVLIFQFYPTIFSFYISFTQWNLLTPPKWVGFSNFVELFTTDRFFFNTMSNTATYAVWTVIVGLALGLIFAVLLNQEIRGKYIYRAIYFVPVVAPTVAVALLWQLLYDPNFGVFNALLKMVHIQGPNWLGNTHWALRSVIFEAIWAGLGFTILIFLAGLQGISQEYYEAAEIDGANAVQKFFFITMPLLSPTTFFLLVTGVIGSFQVFDIPFVMTGGGPANATQMVMMYLYNNAFTIQKMGLAAAVAFIVFLVIILLTIFNFSISKRWVFYE